MRRETVRGIEIEEVMLRPIFRYGHRIVKRVSSTGGRETRLDLAHASPVRTASIFLSCLSRTLRATRSLPCLSLRLSLVCLTYFHCASFLARNSFKIVRFFSSALSQSPSSLLTLLWSLPSLA